jgi:predicted RNase H-like nuclease (RuvC/YqgF family)
LVRKPFQLLRGITPSLNLLNLKEHLLFKEVERISEGIMKTKYLSPVYKLLKLFKEGRDNWKRKTARAKKELKLRHNRIVFLERSKGKLKEKVSFLENKLVILQAELAQLKSETKIKNDQEEKKTLQGLRKRKI